MKELPNPDRNARFLGGLFDLLLAAIRPDKSLHLRWYDRVINGIGAIILVAILLGMLYVALTRVP